MASTTNPLSSAPPTLSGISKFAGDFQSILTRAVSIAQLPLTQLQNQDSYIIQKETLLASLGSSVAGLGSSLVTLGTLGQNKALVANSSDSSTVSVHATSASA